MGPAQRELEDVVASMEQMVGQASASLVPRLIGAFARLGAIAQIRMLQGPTPTAKTETYLSMQEVAVRLNLPESYCYELARKGKLTAVRHGKYIRVPETAIIAYLAQLTPQRP